MAKEYCLPTTIFRRFASQTTNMESCCIPGKGDSRLGKPTKTASFSTSVKRDYNFNFGGFISLSLLISLRGDDYRTTTSTKKNNQY